MGGKEFEDQIEKELSAAGFTFEREAAIGGLRPDFIVNGPRGEIVIVEAKVWNPRGGNTARALQQVELYRKATGADTAFLLLPDLKKPTVHICSTPPSQLPFDVQNWSTLSYSCGQTAKLRNPLTRRLSSALA